MKQNNTHTTGPWEVRISPSTDLIVQQKQDNVLFPPMIATVSRWLDDDELVKQEARANACLIAASPDLLQACQFALEWLRAIIATHPEAVEARDWGTLTIEAAIAKSTGQ